MAARHIASARVAQTMQLSDIAALRRQLDQVELDLKENKNINIRIDAIKKQCDSLQNESKEMLANAAQKELSAHDDRQYYMKRTKETNEVIKALNDSESVDACFLMDCTLS